MAEEKEKPKEKPSLSDIILSEKSVGPWKRIISAPWFRKEETRLKDLSAEIYNYADNGIAYYIDDIADRDPKLGKQVHDEVFHSYAGSLLEMYRPSVRWAEANDTLDKAMALVDASVEEYLDMTIVGIPASMVYKAVGAVMPLVSLGVIYFNTVRRNLDPATKREQGIFYLKAATGLVGIEASEFIPFAGELIGNSFDVYDLYVIAANQTIARGTSRGQFDAYFQQNFPELYARAVGGPIIDAVAKDVPAEKKEIVTAADKGIVPGAGEDIAPGADEGMVPNEWPPEGQ